MCSSVENCFARGLNDKAYTIIKPFYGTYKSRAKVLRGKNLKIVLEDREKILFWKEYIEELYKVENTDIFSLKTKKKVRKILKKIKNKCEIISFYTYYSYICIFSTVLNVNCF